MSKEGKLISISLLMGILYVYLLVGKARGVSFTIFIGLLLFLLVYSVKVFERQIKNKICFFTIPMVLLSLHFILSSNELFLFFDHKIIYILFAVVAMFLMRDIVYDWGIPSFLLDIILVGFTPFSYFMSPYKYIVEKLKTKKTFKTNENFKKILIGIGISLPLLIFIISLLSSADMIFEEMLSFIPRSIHSMFQNASINNIIWKLIIGLFVSTYLYAFIWNLNYSEYSKKTIKEELTTNNVTPFKIDTTIAITVLTMVNMVYILFCFIQFSYLFGGGHNNLPGGFTYAEYARRGFFELLVVTVINFGIILFTLYLSEKNSSKASKVIGILLILMGLSTLVMIYSSYYRMNLYQENYGYTYLRIFVYFFLLLETTLLLGTLGYIIKPCFHLGKTYVIISIVFYIGLSYLNVDHFIAKKNIDRYFTTGKIDMNYLKHLSSDSASQMERLLTVDDTSIAQGAKEYFYYLWEDLKEKDAWQAFNLSDYRARQIINQYDIHDITPASSYKNRQEY